MKVRMHVIQSEMWSVWGLREPNPDSDYERECSIEVDEETLKKWREASKVFHETQNEISRTVRESLGNYFD